jgi:hypothetical protein
MENLISVLILADCIYTITPPKIGRYSQPDKTNLKDFYPSLAEGAIVCDKSSCIKGKDYHKIMLEEPTVREFIKKGFKVSAGSMIPYREGSIVRKSEAIGYEDYFLIWEKKGARVGYRRKNKVVWNDGVEEDI